MMTTNENYEEIKNIISGAQRIYEQAYELYYSESQMLIKRLSVGDNVRRSEIEMFLDGILSFCNDDRILSLFKQVYRLSYKLYPQMIAEYVEFYKSLYLQEDDDI